ncbi:MAG: glycosyltransferase [Dysgonamonadaceae bacterium]|jgi:hypothetical protein|nr:glycosyltransferase [Dysgonamonadaceae bacterium]
MQKEHKCAPVLIPTLCRNTHLKRCVESLKSNGLAKDTPLYIALDYPLNESHRAGYNAIDKFLDDLDGFASITIIRRNENFGAGKNIADAIKMIFEKYDRFIFSEDDNEFAPNFLEYINEGLDRFESQKEVFAVCGYNYPVKMPCDYNLNHFYARMFSAWGYGTWRDRHNQYRISCNFDYVKSVLNRLTDVRKLNSYSEMPIRHSLNMIRNKHLTGDTIICLKLITENLYCVFPTISKVRNHGYDGSGIHCGVNEIYHTQPIDDKHTFAYDETSIQEDRNINLLIKCYFAFSFPRRIKLLLLYLLYRINLLKYF